ncbi:MAG: transglutaminase-like domain-containing protein, partial [Patescibacteria group bacterium]
MRAHQKAHPQSAELKKGSLTQHHADLLGDVFLHRGEAQAFLETNPAVSDRAPERLAERLLQHMVPSVARAKRPTIWNRLRGAFGRAELPRTQDTIADRPSFELMGGGGENLADIRRVIETREDMDELLAQGIYGRYDADTRRWEKVYFPVRRESPDPAREVTFTLVDVAGAGRVSLMLPLDARLITERVRGLTKQNREIPIEPSVNSIGEATVLVPPEAVRILYSIERPLVPEPMHDPTAREFERFVRDFEWAYGKDMTARLASLPHDVEAELKRPEFTSLTPKEKVLRIEELARRVCWYDVNNQEVSGEKVGKPPEDQIAICEERLEELRTGKDPSAFAGKKFAGVCADFALITCALLRKAGLPAGILTGFHIKGKAAEMKDAHATAFVPWPDGRGGIRIVPVDGTPSSDATIAANVARPSLIEIEAQAAEIVTKEVKEAESVIAELLKSTKAHDVASIRKLTNSK